MFNSDEKFPCTMCGACCANMGKVVEQAKVYEIDLGFNFPINEDGSCGHRMTMTTGDGKPAVGCAIYERRPFICQVELGVPESSRVLHADCGSVQSVARTAKRRR